MRLGLLISAAAARRGSAGIRRAGRRFPPAARRALSLAAARESRPTPPRSASATMTTAIRDISPAARDRRAREEQAFLARLRGDPRPTSCRLPTGSTARSCAASSARTSRPMASRQRDMLFTTYYGWHQGFAGLARGLPFRTRADFESYLTRLAQYPRLNDAGAGDHRQCGARRPRPALLGARRLRAHHLRRDRRRSRPVALLRAVRRQPAGDDRRRRTGRRCRRGRGRIITDVHQPRLSEASRFLHARLSAALRALGQHPRPAARRRILCLPGARRTRPPT